MSCFYCQDPRGYAQLAKELQEAARGLQEKLSTHPTHHDDEHTGEEQHPHTD